MIFDFYSSNWVALARSSEMFTQLALPGIAICLKQPYRNMNSEPLSKLGKH